jgi:ATP-dependent Clp protease ATP-binding subunit ClpC
MSQPIDFTPASRVVLSQARREAADLGHEIVGTEHVLLALLNVKDPALTTTFANLELNPAIVRGTTLAMLGISPEAQVVEHASAVGDVPELPFTRRMKDAIEWAMREAMEFNAGRVSSSNLLLGLLREGEGVAATALARSGVTIEKARDASRDH